MNRLLIVGVCCWLTCAPVHAHDGHSSTTEIEWNSESQCFETSMRLRIADLEDALSVRAGRQIRLSEKSQRDPQAILLIRKYLESGFQIVREQTTYSRVRWAGMEFELHHVWVYFECGARTSALRQSSGKEGVSVPTVNSWDELFQDAAPAGPSRDRSRLSGIQVKSTLLTEIQPEQVNVVQLRSHGAATSVALSAKEPAAVFGPRQQK